MCHKIISSLAALPESLKPRGAGHYGHLNVAFYHHAEELEQDSVQSKWYKIAYAKLIRLAHILKNVEQINGRFTKRNSSSIITDDHIISYMKTFNSLAKAFIGSSSMQCAYKKGITPADRSVLATGFHEPNKRDSMMLNSLTRVCDFLNISAQQRKSIRLTVCPQVTQHHIWRGALEQVLRDLKYEMNSLRCCSPTFQMGEQIVSSCIKFCADATYISNSVSPSWMRPAPLKKVEKSLPSRRWEEVLEMFVDLTKCLGQEERLSHHVLKLEAMKEGLYQIKDILVERDISYKEARREDCLIQKKLTKSLGHSSKCLFTLLLYYLYGTVRDIEIEVSGGVYETDGRFYLSIGKIVTSSDESMVWNGVKQLNRALGVFKFVWETAAMKGVLELQGHLWCMGAEEKILTYRVETGAEKVKNWLSTFLFIANWSLDQLVTSMRWSTSARIEHCVGPLEGITDLQSANETKYAGLTLLALMVLVFPQCILRFPVVENNCRGGGKKRKSLVPSDQGKFQVGNHEIR